MQYASSVHPNQTNYSYNSTYSSPVVNLASAQASDDKYMATGLATTSTPQNFTITSQTYTPSGTPTPQQATNQIYSSINSNQHLYSAGSVSAVSSASFPGTASTEHTYSGLQHGYSSSSQVQQTQPVAGTQNYPAVAQSYPTPDYSQTGGSTGQQLGVAGSSTAFQAYQTAQYPSAAGVYQGYSGGVAAYQPGVAVSASDPNVAAGYSNYYAQGYPQYAAPVTTQQSTTPAPAKTKESNVDLLSGLDFTISQAPLIPQQNVPAKTEPSETKPVVVESKSPAPKVVPVKEEKPASEVKRLNVKILPSKQLNNSDVKSLFVQEIEKYEKYVETLTNKTLSGPTNLDIKWNELQDKREAEGQKKIISVARCYPMKNRFPDILPYDYTRVELHGTKDDYINASFVYVSSICTA